MKLLSIFAGLGLAVVTFGIPHFPQAARWAGSVSVSDSTNKMLKGRDKDTRQTDIWWQHCDLCRYHNNKCKKQTKHTWEECQRINCHTSGKTMCLNCRNANCGPELEPLLE